MYPDGQNEILPYQQWIHQGANQTAHQKTFTSYNGGQKVAKCKQNHQASRHDDNMKERIFSFVRKEEKGIPAQASKQDQNSCIFGHDTSHDTSHYSHNKPNNPDNLSHESCLSTGV